MRVQARTCVKAITQNAPLPQTKTVCSASPYVGKMTPDPFPPWRDAAEEEDGGEGQRRPKGRKVATKASRLGPSTGSAALIMCRTLERSKTGLWL